ncbi:leucine-rich repeat-containing protein 2 [Gouania willdenowi]|uniref:Leucine-rich repeat protein SHOC-2 n=1 Tax=Gouania willdenowi TaxID=441366 RepID=A0A8C5EK42_GOUWI|nr:leucine-rich repeat-containing protein 2 [Gouania willdenowi]XP_028312486.1 leucine-rich repeat-containing protein 2 [Gouania willdenowi]
MGLERKAEGSFCDVSLLRGMWEVRVKKQQWRQKKERDRVEKSALSRIEQQWQYRIYCKTLKTSELNQLQRYLERNTLSQQPSTHTDEQQQDNGISGEDHNRLVFQLEGDQWTNFPRELQWSTYLTEWNVVGTRIRLLPDFLPLFTQLTKLHMPRNAISELPPEIGQLRALKELNVSYNHLSKVPAELGDCENLLRLELSGNRNLSELPFELKNLKQLLHLDISENVFVSIPICTLRMSSLQFLDLSNNRLTDLPEDMDRLEQLVTLFVHRNSLSYLPQCLSNISSLKMIVVSGEMLVCTPTRLCSNPDIKFIRLLDNPSSRTTERKKEEEKEKERRWRTAEQLKDSREKEFMEAYISSLKDRDSVPYSTTKVSISLL